ncbi:hypothetical protein K503DRAFT_851103 [Rhizopogon vinicolor AM-OR11-026]|uniref:F-box domain-containing protein n=1 Tax=Rhizopogon vinicolor AM-OR11-026 TaxID=1314800 RepID=A0A1B7MTQ1_9AGAM|nr:hypothetical protein K503DRAFT_851103 [Rhizopogon vinicolor AM-OR11-026]
MQGLPVELINAVVENVSSPTDLLHLRRVNRTYLKLVTPLVFSKLHVKNSIQSAQNFQQVIGTADLATHIREVVYDSRDNESFQFPPENVELDHTLEVAELEEALTEAFCAITALPNLDSVELNFWPSFISQSGKEVRQSPFWFANRQLMILEAIYHVMKTSHMTSLSLNNVVMMPSSSYDFVSSLTNSPLSHLSLSVVSNAEISAWSGSKDINGSLGALLPPSNPTLRSLVLHSPQGSYHSLTTQLSSFHYPSLARLVLGNIILDQTPSADGVEAFVLRHKDSLCSPADARRWSSIWQRWMVELTGLDKVVVDSDSQGHRPIGPMTAEEDTSSLQMFQDVVAARKVMT